MKGQPRLQSETLTQEKFYNLKVTKNFLLLCYEIRV